MKLRITDYHYKEIRRITSLSFLDGLDFPPETGCILLIGQNNHRIRQTLLVADVLQPQEGDIQEQYEDGLVFSSSYLRLALLQVRERNLAGFLTVHTHPFSDDRVAFSGYDDANDPLLMSNLSELQPSGIFGSLVLGKQSVAGRIWKSEVARFFSFDEIAIVGESLQSINLKGTASASAPEAAAIFDRGLAITNEGALSRLSQMRIGVVGASGTGSLIVELLARAGVKEVLLFDYDAIEDVNLNRILHSRKCDAEAHTNKSLRLAEAINSFDLPTHIIPLPDGDIRKKATALELRSCDLIFGCIDRDWPRLILCELSYQYLIPLIDLGTEIGIGNGTIQSVDSRVSYVAPGRPCLHCSGILSDERIRLEALSNNERERVIAMGYCENINLTAPAVMDLNMRAASYAMLITRHLLQPFLDTPLPTHIKETLTNFSIKAIRIEQMSDCLICSNKARLGIGDAGWLTSMT